MSELPPSTAGAQPSVRPRATAIAMAAHARPVSVREPGDAGSPQPSGTSRSTAGTAPEIGSTRAVPLAARRHDDDVLTVADAARVARRSVRTLRRAYLSGRLTAHRDGNGRGVSIRYGDLRAWLTAEVIVSPPAQAPVRVIPRINMRANADTDSRSGNPELLATALQRRRRRSRAAASPRNA